MIYIYTYFQHHNQDTQHSHDLQVPTVLPPSSSTSHFHSPLLLVPTPPHPFSNSAYLQLHILQHTCILLYISLAPFPPLPCYTPCRAWWKRSHLKEILVSLVSRNNRHQRNGDFPQNLMLGEGKGVSQMGNLSPRKSLQMVLSSCQTTLQGVTHQNPVSDQQR